MSTEVIVTFISTVGGIVITYITYVLARKKRASGPRDPMSTIFEGYDKLIKQQQVDIDRKGEVITSLENVVKRLETELDHTRQLLNQARTDLSSSRQQNEELKTQLMDMRKQYDTNGTV